jgi:hypothetical protein
MAVVAAAGYAQYPGHIDTSQQQGGAHLRATAILEYTGDLPDPKASRLIPLVVWDGTQYQPGGLYLAQPAPLAVQSGTQYILESEGSPKGFFNIQEAENLGGHWIGVGKYLAPPVPKPRPPAAKHMPQVVKDYDPDKPHFAHVPRDESQAGQTDSTSTSSAPSVDPSRPTLHERPGSGSGANSGSPSASSRPDVDPDRPTFHRHDEESARASATTARNAQPSADPDRPLLSYSAPVEQEKLDKPDALSGVPEEMKQMAGVSDTKAPSDDSFQYSWANPEDADKMKAALQAIAEQAVAPVAETSKAAAEKKTHGRVSRLRHRHSATPAAPKAPLLADEQFKVYGLTFGGGATMVLTARTASDPVRYVTIIAQPDFYGRPQVLLKHVTTEAELDVVPRMRLVDAVDTEGNGRADLIFELRGRTWRQFAIYRIAGGTATQAFATQPTGL